MSNPKPVLKIEPPNKLLFRGSFNEPITTFIKLSNPTDRRVMYKMKTNTLKQFCVRPTLGVLAPKESTNISIRLYPCSYDLMKKKSPEFIVQTAFTRSEADIDEELWNEILVGDLMESPKIKCAFEIQFETSDTDEEWNETTSKQEPSCELQEAAKQVQQLRENLSWLRQEQLELQREILILQQEPVIVEYIMVTPTAPNPMAQLKLSAVAIIMGLLGVLVGKFGF